MTDALHAAGERARGNGRCMSERLEDILRAAYGDASERRWLTREDWERALRELLHLATKHGRDTRYLIPRRRLSLTAPLADLPLEPCEQRVVTLREAIERVEWFVGYAA